jgi:hypothetical protein
MQTFLDMVLDKVKPIAKNLKPIALLVDSGSVLGAFYRGDRNAQISTSAGLAAGTLSLIPRRAGRIGGPLIGITTFIGGVIIDQQVSSTKQAIDDFDESSERLYELQMRILAKKALDKLNKLTMKYERCCE